MSDSQITMVYDTNTVVIVETDFEDAVLDGETLRIKVYGKPGHSVYVYEIQVPLDPVVRTVMGLRDIVDPLDRS